MWAYRSNGACSPRHCSFPVLTHDQPIWVLVTFVHYFSFQLIDSTGTYTRVWNGSTVRCCRDKMLGCFHCSSSSLHWSHEQPTLYAFTWVHFYPYEHMNCGDVYNLIDWNSSTAGVGVSSLFRERQEPQDTSPANSPGTPNKQGWISLFLAAIRGGHGDTLGTWQWHRLSQNAPCKLILLDWCMAQDVANACQNIQISVKNLTVWIGAEIWFWTCVPPVIKAMLFWYCSPLI